MGIFYLVFKNREKDAVLKLKKFPFFFTNSRDVAAQRLYNKFYLVIVSPVLTPGSFPKERVEARYFNLILKDSEV